MADKTTSQDVQLNTPEESYKVLCAK